MSCKINPTDMNSKSAKLTNEGGNSHLYNSIENMIECLGDDYINTFLKVVKNKGLQDKLYHHIGLLTNKEDMDVNKNDECICSLEKNYLDFSGGFTQELERYPPKKQSTMAAKYTKKYREKNKDIINSKKSLKRRLDKEVSIRKMYKGNSFTTVKKLWSFLVDQLEEWHIAISRHSNEPLDFGSLIFFSLEDIFAQHHNITWDKFYAAFHKELATLDVKEVVVQKEYTKGTFRCNVCLICCILYEKKTKNK